MCTCNLCISGTENRKDDLNTGGSGHTHRPLFLKRKKEKYSNIKTHKNRETVTEGSPCSQITDPTNTKIFARVAVFQPHLALDFSLLKRVNADLSPRYCLSFRTERLSLNSAACIVTPFRVRTMLLFSMNSVMPPSQVTSNYW